MKNQNLKKLQFKKTAISKLEATFIKGGTYNQPTQDLECWDTIYITKCNGRRNCEFIDPS